MAHHHQPAHLLAQWACADAWELVHDPTEGLRHHDAGMLADQSRYRKWPLCVQRKREEKARRRFTRSTVEDTCCIEGFYSIPEFTDPIERALAWMMFASDDDKEGVEIHNQADLLRLAHRYEHDDPAMAERMLAQHLDTPVKAPLRRIRQGHNPSRRERTLVTSFISVAFLRSPSWFNHYFEDTARPTLARSRSSTIENLAEQLGGEAARGMTAAMNQVMKRTMYPRALALAAEARVNFLKKVHPKVTLLETDGVPFVLGDNPARAYHPDRVLDAGLYPRPGMADHTAVISYPIGPRHCLMVHSTPSARKFSRDKADDGVVRTVNTAMLLFASNELIYPGPDRDMFLDGVDPDAVDPWIEPGV